MRCTWMALPLIALAAPAAAQSYRATGLDPAWRLTIDGATMRFEETGKRPIVVTRPPAQTSSKGERYVARGLTVEAISARCSNADSDRVFRDVVIIEIGGRVLQGCGSPFAGAPAKPTATSVAPAKPSAAPPKPVGAAKPTAAPKPVASAKPAPPPPPKPAAPPAGPRSILTDTRWTVWQLNGKALPADPVLTVEFPGNRIEGTLCNRFRGQFALTGEQLRVGNLASTRKMCPGPVMTAENMLFAMWRAPVVAKVSKWGTLILTAGSNSVTLRPVR